MFDDLKTRIEQMKHPPLRPPTLLAPPPGTVTAVPPPRAQATLTGPLLTPTPPSPTTQTERSEAAPLETEETQNTPLAATPTPPTTARRQYLGRSAGQLPTVPTQLWAGMEQPAPATAKHVDQQIEQLAKLMLTLLQPLPTSLITLKQLAEETTKRPDIQLPLLNLQQTLDDLKQSLAQQRQQTGQDSTTEHLHLITEQLKQTNQTVLEVKAQLKALPQSTHSDPSSTPDHKKQHRPWLEIPIGRRRWNFAKPLEVVLIICCTASLTAALIQYHPKGVSHLNDRINDVLIKLGSKK